MRQQSRFTTKRVRVNLPAAWPAIQANPDRKRRDRLETATGKGTAGLEIVPVSFRAANCWKGAFRRRLFVPLHFGGSSDSFGGAIADCSPTQEVI